jgi:RNA polymerase sigma-70 factor (ECF subfamily)
MLRTRAVLIRIAVRPVGEVALVKRAHRGHASEIPHQGLKTRGPARVVEGVEAEGAPSQVTVEMLGGLYESSYHRYLRVAEAIVGDVELATDVVQDAFARAIRARSSYRATGSIEGWVWRTVVNAARNARRDKPPPHLQLDELSLNGSPAGDASSTDVRALIASLPERQRLVLFLRYYADLDYRGIATALEIQEGTVGATLNQAHVALRRALEEVSA